MSKPVKLYDWSIAPNPRRLRIYIAEKGLNIPKEDVFDKKAGGLSAAFQQKFPRATTPALELDDGTVIGDAAACMRYLEKVYPTPSMFGPDAKSAAIVDQWEHQAYEDGLMGAAESFRNSDKSPFPYAIPGVFNSGKTAALVERGKLRAAHFWGMVEKQLEGKEFLCGNFFSAADITALCAYDFAKGACGIKELGGPNVARWHAAVSGRGASKM